MRRLEQEIYEAIQCALLEMVDAKQFIATRRFQLTSEELTNLLLRLGLNVGVQELRRLQAKCNHDGAHLRLVRQREAPEDLGVDA